MYSRDPTPAATAVAAVAADQQSAHDDLDNKNDDD
jgi:hypothetical protein